MIASYILPMIQATSAASFPPCLMARMEWREGFLDYMLSFLPVFHVLSRYENINNMAERKGISGDGNILHIFVKHLGRLQMKVSTNTKCLVFVYIDNVKPLVPTKATQSSIDINYEIASMFSALTTLLVQLTVFPFPLSTILANL